MTALTSGNLFDLDVTPQQENLNRCLRIAPHILDFCRDLMASGRSQFRLAELTGYVTARETISPSSVDRILRELRKKGRLDYVIVSRRGSLYRLTRVEG